MAKKTLTGFVDADATNVSITLNKTKEGWGGSASARGNGLYVPTEVEPQFGSAKAVSSYLMRDLAYLWYKEVFPEDEKAETLQPLLEDEEAAE